MTPEDQPVSPPEGRTGLLSRRITQRNLIAALAAGFALKLILMVSLIQSRHTRSMEASADELVQEQLRHCPADQSMEFRMSRAR